MKDNKNKKTCTTCAGAGRVEVKPGKWKDCPDCLEKPATFNTRGIPRQIRARFKAVCAEHGVTMNDAMIALMECVADSKKFPPNVVAN